MFDNDPLPLLDDDFDVVEEQQCDRTNYDQEWE
jgi:hypothetical protein